MTEKKNIKFNFTVPYIKSENQAKQLIISSHERSGTHYLMNTIDHSFKFYSSKNFINFDYNPFGSLINFYSPKSISKLLNDLYLNNNISILKNHFHPMIFENINKDILNNIKFIFIYRDLIETLKSFWIFINNVNWYEGPKIKTFSKFCFSRPIGQLTRYNFIYSNDFIERYFLLIKGWLEFQNRNNVLFINFNDLQENYTQTLKKISTFIDQPIVTNAVYIRKNYFEVKYNKIDNLNFDEKNNKKIKERFKKLLSSSAQKSKIYKNICND